MASTAFSIGIALCPNCKKKYDNVQMLPCSHQFCFRCTENMKNETKITCVKCLLICNENEIIVNDYDMLILNLKSKYDSICIFNNDFYATYCTQNKITIDIYSIINKTYNSLSFIPNEEQNDISYAIIINTEKNIFIYYRVFLDIYLLKYDHKKKIFEQLQEFNFVCCITTTFEQTLLVRTSTNKLIELSEDGIKLNKIKIIYRSENDLKFNYFIYDHKLINEKYVVTSFNDKFFLITLIDAKGNAITNFKISTNENIRTCSDGKNYIFILEMNEGSIQVFSKNLEFVEKFNFPGIDEIFYDKNKNKLILVKEKTIFYFTYYRGFSLNKYIDGQDIEENRNIDFQNIDRNKINRKRTFSDIKNDKIEIEENLKHLKTYNDQNYVLQAKFSSKYSDIKKAIDNYAQELIEHINDNKEYMKSKIQLIEKQFKDYMIDQISKNNDAIVKLTSTKESYEKVRKQYGNLYSEQISLNFDKHEVEKQSIIHTININFKKPVLQNIIFYEWLNSCTYIHEDYDHEKKTKKFVIWCPGCTKEYKNICFLNCKHQLCKRCTTVTNNGSEVVCKICLKKTYLNDIKNINQVAKCLYCNEPYDEVNTLPCNHQFCAKCTNKMKNTEVVICKICCKKFSIENVYKDKEIPFKNNLQNSKNIVLDNIELKSSTDVICILNRNLFAVKIHDDNIIEYNIYNRDSMTNVHSYFRQTNKVSKIISVSAVSTENNIYLYYQLENDKSTYIWEYNDKYQIFQDFKTYDMKCIITSYKNNLLVRYGSILVELSEDKIEINQFEIPLNATFPSNNFSFAYKLDNGQYIVSALDTKSFNLSLLDKNQKYLNSSPEQPGSDIIICINNKKHIFVLDTNVGNIKVFSTNFKLINEKTYPDVKYMYYDKTIDKVLLVQDKFIFYFV